MSLLYQPIHIGGVSRSAACRHILALRTGKHTLHSERIFAATVVNHLYECYIPLRYDTGADIQPLHNVALQRRIVPGTAEFE